MHRAVAARQRRLRRTAAEQALAAVSDRVEDRLHVGDRAADDRRISAVAVCRSSASLRLVEQAHVLDRDHRLVGEGLQQRDLLVARRARLGRAHG